MLIKRNRTRYWLAEETGIRYHNLIKICDNKTSSISFDVLERICRALQCTPGDIIILD
ncbi:MAG: helix-turn-helix transcriptional regulator [Bacillota bacterium]